MNRKGRHRRGFPVAILIGFDENRAVLWQVFSLVVKPYVTLKLSAERSNAKSLYGFHESIVNVLKPVLKEGVKTIIIAEPARTVYAAQFLNHVRRHHGYLSQAGTQNTATFATLVGCATDAHEVSELVKTKEFDQLTAEATSEEANQIVNMLEKSLYRADMPSDAIFSLDEIEHVIYERQKDIDLKHMYLVLTNKYIVQSGRKDRINRLLQICKNKNIKTRILDAESPAGIRVSQFGGIAFFIVPTN